MGNTIKKYIELIISQRIRQFTLLIEFKHRQGEFKRRLKLWG